VSPVGLVVATWLTIGGPIRLAVLAMIPARGWTSSTRRPGSSRSSGVAACGWVRNFRVSCTGALRVESLLVVGASTGQASQQTVEPGSNLHHVARQPEP